MLHDRRIPDSRANIDHIAVAPSGVWVIDAKRYKGKVTIDRPLLGKPRLLINRRDQTKLIDGLDRQIVLVRAAMEQIAPETQTRGVLCFVDADLPLFRTLTFSGYPLLYPKRLAKRINRAGPAWRWHRQRYGGGAGVHLRGDIAGTPSAWRTQAMRVPASTTTGLHEKPSSQRVAVNAFTPGRSRRGDAGLRATEQRPRSPRSLASVATG